MKTVFTAFSAVALAAGFAASPTSAMPRLDVPSAVSVAPPALTEARLVCNYRRCWHVGGYRYRYYRPYGYYRPYYYGPRLGIGVGPFGVRIF